MQMKVIDGVKVLKLEETHQDERGHADDTVAMFHLWSLLTGAEGLKDHTPVNRRLL